jgi:hypothetical protein
MCSPPFDCEAASQTQLFRASLWLDCDASLGQLAVKPNRVDADLGNRSCCAQPYRRRVFDIEQSVEGVHGSKAVGGALRRL